MCVRRENTCSIHVHHFLPLYPHIVPMIPHEHRFRMDPHVWKSSRTQKFRGECVLCVWLSAMVWMFVSAQNPYAEIPTTSDAIRRWGLWKVFSSWGWSPYNRIRAFIKVAPRNHLTPSATWGRRERRQLRTRKKVLIRKRPCWSLGLGLPRTVRNKFLSFISSQPVVFCYSSLNRLKLSKEVHWSPRRTHFPFKPQLSSNVERRQWVLRNMNDLNLVLISPCIHQPFYTENDDIDRKGKIDPIHFGPIHFIPSYSSLSWSRVCWQNGCISRSKKKI